MGPLSLDGVAIAIICKTPRVGRSKTRLIPALGAERAAAASAAFIADTAEMVDELARRRPVSGVAAYAPRGTRAGIAAHLPASFALIHEWRPDFGEVLLGTARRLLARRRGVVLLNSDSPTMPPALVEAAVEALLASPDQIVLGPAVDGGYTFIGLNRAHERLFTDMPWSTERVFEISLARARELVPEPLVVDAWYDVDDVESLGYLRAELGGGLPFPGASRQTPGPARRTRALFAA
jgi:rSAM/selenodomain-associated transferase 1